MPALHARQSRFTSTPPQSVSPEEAAAAFGEGDSNISLFMDVSPLATVTVHSVGVPLGGTSTSRLPLIRRARAARHVLRRSNLPRRPAAVVLGAANQHRSCRCPALPGDQRHTGRPRRLHFGGPGRRRAARGPRLPGRPAQRAHPGGEWLASGLCSRRRRCGPLGGLCGSIGSWHGGSCMHRERSSVAPLRARLPPAVHPLPGRRWSGRGRRASRRCPSACKAWRTDSLRASPRWVPAEQV